MYKLSDTIERKFVDSIEVSDWEIESEDGWVDITHINKTIEYDVYVVETEHCRIECADTHILFRITGEEVFAKDLIVGDVIKGQHGSELVTTIHKTDRKEHMYDLSVTGPHTYYAEGLLHHNTISVAAYLLHYALFNDDKTIAVLANKAAAAREILSRFQLMYENLPLFIQQGVKEWNKGSCELENGTKIFTAATSSSGIRGRSVNILYLDEAAAVPNTVAEDFFTATYPTISSGKTTKVILTSTPIGLNHFWKFWNDAEKGINGFTPIKVHYSEHPNRDAAWAAEQLELLGETKFKQEVSCEFLGSSNTLINAATISNMTSMVPIYQNDDGFVAYEPVFRGEFNDQTQKWIEAPASYVLVADTAAGLGGDSNAFTIIRVDKTPYKIAARFKNNKISALLYPSIIHKWAQEYNDAWALIELNKNEQVPHILHNELEYENIIFVNKTNKGQIVTGGFGAGKARLGVLTDKKVKRIGCSMFKTMAEAGKLIIPDPEIISEISTFVERKGSYAADDGESDDLVMTLVLYGWLTSQPYFKELTDINLRTEIFNQRMKMIEEEVLPLGHLCDGTENVEDINSSEGWVDYPH